MTDRTKSSYIIRTPLELDDAIAAYTALRVALLTEITHTAATTDDYSDPAIREVDHKRLAEARAQLERVDGTLALLASRSRQH